MEFKGTQTFRHSHREFTRGSGVGLWKVVKTEVRGRGPGSQGPPVHGLKRPLVISSFRGKNISGDNYT